MANWILIKNGMVVNTIVADESFIELIKNDYDEIIDHDAHPQNVAPDDKAVLEEDGSWFFIKNDIHVAQIAPLTIIDNPTLEINAPTDALIDLPIEGA